MITIAYMTCRRNPRIEWFRDSLRREAGIGFESLRVIVVDYLQRERPLSIPVSWHHVTPKPCVWQGRHRLTQHDYFAAASARNTAICYTLDDYLVFVDDLSVLYPGWFAAVREAAAAGYVVCGTYRKVFDLVVESGAIKFFQNNPKGNDHRAETPPFSTSERPLECHPGWTYGCSLGAPLEAFLRINGWDERADGMGYEDTALGGMMARQGYSIRFDKRMLTIEDEAAHGEETALRRLDKGKSPDDKSHAFVRLFMGTKSTPNFGQDLRALRSKIIAGGSFPIPIEPSHDWYDQQPLCEM